MVRGVVAVLHEALPEVEVVLSEVLLEVVVALLQEEDLVAEVRQGEEVEALVVVALVEEAEVAADLLRLRAVLLRAVAHTYEEFRKGRVGTDYGQKHWLNISCTRGSYIVTEYCTSPRLRDYSSLLL